MSRHPHSCYRLGAMLGGHYMSQSLLGLLLLCLWVTAMGTFHSWCHHSCVFVALGLGCECLSQWRTPPGNLGQSLGNLWVWVWVWCLGLWYVFNVGTLGVSKDRMLYTSAAKCLEPDLAARGSAGQEEPSLSQTVPLICFWCFCYCCLVQYGNSGHRAC